MNETAVIQRLDDMVARIERHDHVIHGNGQPGLVSEVRLLVDNQQRMTDAFEKIDARCARMEKFIYVAMGVVMASKFVAEWVLHK